MTHILSFHAHPDDTETLAAGTLALLVANGHRVTIATMTAGDCGAIDTDAVETARIRRAEAATATAMIGADYVCAGIGDLAVFNDDATRRRTVELLRAVQPDVVITGSPADYHPDHEATSILVRDGCFAAPIRRAEAATATAMIGADYVCAGIGDLAVFNDDATRRRTVELLRAVQPDVVITGSPADYHPDHEATSILVRDGCFAAPIRNYQTGSSPLLKQIPHLYFMDPIEGRDRDGSKVAPQFCVDITAHLATKRAMLASHVSQHRWVDKQHGISDFTQAMERFGAKRGKPFGVAYAEGFRQYTGTPYPRSELLQELVGVSLLKM